MSYVPIYNSDNQESKTWYCTCRLYNIQYFTHDRISIDVQICVDLDYYSDYATA